MTVYLIAKLKITDREEYGLYEAGFMEIFDQYKGSLLSVDEEPEIIEGSWDGTRSVLTSFPSAQDAKDWYESEAYQNLVKHRFAASTGDIIQVRGLDEMMG